MTDVVDQNTRSKMMKNITSSDTQPEIILRKALYSEGFRYRKNEKSLPGSPDIFILRHNVALFVNGCF